MVCFMMLVFIQTNLLPVKAEGEISTYKYIENIKSKKYEDFEYMYCDICEGIVIVKYIGKGKKVVVPNKINDIEVKELGDFAFWCCETVQEVVLPDSIKIIGSDCFNHCTNLRKMDIPEGVTYLDSTFSGCKKLTSVSLPESLSRIGWETFEDCKSLKKITIPDQVMEIGKQAFNGCDNLREIQLPKELKRIEKEAFKKCKKLKSIKIPDGVFCIEQRAFEGCSALNKVTLPNDLYRIEAGTFKNFCHSAYIKKNGSYVKLKDVEDDDEPSVCKNRYVDAQEAMSMVWYACYYGDLGDEIDFSPRGEDWGKNRGYYLRNILKYVKKSNTGYALKDLEEVYKAINYEP